MDKFSIEKTSETPNQEQLEQLLKEVVDSSLREIQNAMDTAQLMHRAQELLTEKYHTEMEIERILSVNILDQYYDVLAYSQENPDLMFRASINMKKEADASAAALNDSYVMKNVCDRLSQNITNLLGGLQGNYYVYNHAEFMLFWLDDPEITIDQIQQQFPANRFHIHIFMEENDYDAEAVLQTLRTLDGKFPVRNGVVYFYRMDEETFKKTIQHIRSIDVPHSDFKLLTEPYMLGACQLVKGTIQIKMDIF